MDIRVGPLQGRIALLVTGMLFVAPGGLARGLASQTAGSQTTTTKPTTTPATQTPTTKPATTPAAPTTKPATGATPQTTPAKPATTPAPPPPPAPDGNWPRVYFTAKGARLIVYQPQIAGWEQQKLMTAYSAVSYTPKNDPAQKMGTIKISANTRVSVADRLVDFSALKIVESNFPTLDKPQIQDIIDEITRMPMPDRVIALDRVLASIDKSSIIPKNIEGVKADPPVIFFSQTPAIIVNVDGEPIWGRIPENDLMFAVNTNWDLFQLEPAKTFFLRNDKTWLKAASIEGPWSPAGKLPPSFSKLPKDENFKDVVAAVPGKSLSAKSMPKVFVSQKPAELILLKGAPAYEAVEGTQLLWVSNTESDVFRVGKTGLVYYLVAGRWFSSPGFEGPWTFATTALPADFQKIPLEHDRSRVLASVPGTSQAAEAVMLASIPENATVDKKGVKAPEVQYAGGKPEFKPIETTTVERAVNTDKDILKVGDLYYMCFQGVWFIASKPEGPWEVTGAVPKEIYEIPASSPAHNVTYVTVVEDNPTTVVYETSPAYTGLMIAWGCAVWGTGYYYPPYVHYGGFYPAYYPFYPTYGYGAWYNPWTGGYGRYGGVYGPYGGAGVGARYNPATGTYARGAAAWGPYGGAAVGSAYNPRTGTVARGAAVSGPYGSRGAAGAYNPRTGTSAATRQGSGTYGSWGTTGVANGNDWAKTSRVTNDVTGATTRRTTTSEGGSLTTRTGGAGGNSFAGVTGSGDVYAGRDGNVYKKSGDSWQQYGGNGSWNPVTPSAEQRTAAQQRSEGAQRTRDASSVRSGTTSSSRSGSYRPSAPRGGGGGRRR
ncbi:MAG TPA: hypothetical protein VFV98_03465 [Vicinamibacterales bacterium]|nr:hypothetical protein [Vicinamibacterales bacterium]